MKNSNRTGLGSSIRRSASILLILAALAVTNVSMAADFRNGATDNQTNVELSRRDGALNLAQIIWGTVCYTPFGSAPMFYPAPVGSICHVGFVRGRVGL